MGHSLARQSLRQVPMKLPLVSGNNNRIGLQSGSLGATSGLFSTFGRNFFRQSIFVSSVVQFSLTIQVMISLLV